MSRKIAQTKDVKTASPKTTPPSPRGGATTRLKAERVQFSVLLLNDQIHVSAQARLPKGFVREITNNLLALTATLA